MNIDEENKAKEFYIKSAINGIHTPRTNMVEINYLDMLKLMHSYSQEVVKNLSISGVSGSADADYWSERCKHAENIWEKSPCDPDITDEQIEAHNEYHNFIKENGSKHYR